MQAERAPSEGASNGEGFGERAVLAHGGVEVGGRNVGHRGAGWGHRSIGLGGRPEVQGTGDRAEAQRRVRWPGASGAG